VTISTSSWTPSASSSLELAFVPMVDNDYVSSLPNAKNSPPRLETIFVGLDHTPEDGDSSFFQEPFNPFLYELMPEPGS
jgi:hypothetical protein